MSHIQIFGVSSILENCHSFKLLNNMYTYIYLFIFKYILIMLLQLSQFPLAFAPLLPVPPFPPEIPSFSSCLWVMHVSSLASPLPTLFLTSPCLFCTYQLCFLIPAPLPLFSPSPSQLTFHMIFIHMILFLFCLFA